MFTVLHLLSLLLTSSLIQSLEDITFDPIVEPCDPSKSLLDPVTHKFRSNCDLRRWCKPTSTFESDPLLTMPTLVAPLLAERDTAPFPSPPPSAPIDPPSVPIDFGLCVNKTCRRDEYPFGYRGVPFEELPKMCLEEEYCPDDGSQCEPLIPLGGPCQLNRDDSCQKVIGSYDDVLCLRGFCHLANAGLQKPCLIDSTDYLGYNESGSQMIATVTRDDCQSGLYCDHSTNICFQEKMIGTSCTENRECIEYNCDILDTGTCQMAPQRVHIVPIWAWCIIAVAIPSILSTIVMCLYRLHQRHRAIRLEEIDQFFSEQWQYRQAILSMHAAAAQAMTRKDSIASTSRQPRSEKVDLHQEKGWTSSLSPVSTHQDSHNPNLSPRVARHRTNSSSWTT